MTSLNKVAGIVLLVATIGVTSCQGFLKEPEKTPRSLHGTPVEQR
jgi:hypothetical protein